MASEPSAMRPGRLSRDPSHSPYRDRRQQRSISPPFDPDSESAPLLQDGNLHASLYGGIEDRSRPASLALRSSPEFGEHRTENKPRRRWPILIALSLLTVATLLILLLGFAAPEAVKNYAQQAVVFSPTKLSIDSATSSGASLRVQGNVTLDGRRVSQKHVRDIGRIATWVAKEVEIGESEVDVYLPEYDNVLLGTAFLPGVKLDIRDRHVNYIDILAELHSGDIAGIRQVADDWMSGRLGELHVKSIANVAIRSGILNIGQQTISADMRIDGQDIPPLPSINVLKLNVHENPLTPADPSVAVEVSVSVSNDYALSMTIPPLGFDILVPNCSPAEPYILIANTTTDAVNVQPAQPAIVDASGVIKHLPSELTKKCPGKKDSPLDQIISDYMKEHQTTIYVRGADAPSDETPSWMTDLLKSITVPVPVTGHDFGQMIKNFSMSNVHFSMPDPFAEPDSPDAQPQVSALVEVMVDLPKEMNFEVDIPRVRGIVDVYYKGTKFGFLDLSEWQHSNATRINDTSSDDPLLLITFAIEDGPLQITDNDVFSDVVQSLLFGDQPVKLDLKALVDGKIATTLGEFVVHEIPAEGSIDVTSPLGGSTGDSIGSLLNPRIESFDIVHTTQSSVVVEATINFTNPSPYSASIPYVDVLLLSNGTTLAHVSGRALFIVPGNNSGVSVTAVWNPSKFGENAGVIAGREFLSSYVSGFNTTLTMHTHNGTFPNLPSLGQALSNIEFDVPVPNLGGSGGDVDDPNGHNEGNSRFIKDATLHLWSSTAVFTLSSPLKKSSTLFINKVDATAFYNHTEPVGKIDYQLPFTVPPGTSQTPKLPVTLNLDGVGYDAVKKALGGTLRMDAKAHVDVSLGEYSTTLFYQGKGIGAKIRI